MRKKLLITIGIILLFLLLVSGICTPFVQSVFSFIPMTVGLITGMVMIVSSVMKYNK